MNSYKKRKKNIYSLGTIVRLPIPDVDRKQRGSRTILTVVINVKEDGFYRLRTNEGILKQLYVRSQFTLNPKNLLIFYIFLTIKFI